MVDDVWRKSVTLQMDAMHRRHEDMQAQLSELNKTVSDLSKELVDLKKSTAELVDILNSWKGAMKVLTFLGQMARPVTYIATAAATIWGLLHFTGEK